MRIVRLLKQTGLEWCQSRTFELGAALAFYAIFSVAPVIVLAFTAASLVLGKEAAQGRLTQGIESVVGHTVAVAIQATAKHTYRSGSSVSATVLSIVFFGFGATGLFSQLQRALNAIWEVEPKPGRGLRGLLRSARIFFGRPGRQRSAIGCPAGHRGPRCVPGSFPPRPRSNASALADRHVRRLRGVPHVGDRTGLPNLARRQDRLARRLGRGGASTCPVPARQSPDRLVSGGSRRHFGLWGGRFDRDCPAVGLLFFAGRAVRAEFTRVYAKYRGAPCNRRQTRCASTERGMPDGSPIRIAIIAPLAFRDPVPYNQCG